MKTGSEAAAAALPREGDVLAGKYRIDGVLGRGGMGVVYAAYHQLLAQHVALKLLRPEIARHENAVPRFLHEARAAARIQGEHVARVMDVGTLDDGLPYIVLERLQGRDLGQVVAARETLPIQLVVDYVMQALEALAQAHALGIVHRDIKPANLFLARTDDGTTTVKVLDFGIAKTLVHGDAAEGPSVTATNAVLGSPAYMSPEQLRNSRSVDVRTDIWSMGVVLYELLVNRLPFGGQNAVALYAAIDETVARSPSDLRADVPRGLEQAVLRCLRRSPGDRFGSVHELAAALVPHGSAASRGSLERIARAPVAPVAPPRAIPISLEAVRGPSTGIGADDIASRATVLAVTSPSGSTPTPGPAPPVDRRTLADTSHGLTASSPSLPPKASAPRRRHVVWIAAAVAVACAAVLAVGLVQARRPRPAALQAPTSALVEPPVPESQASSTPPASPGPVVSPSSSAPPVSAAPGPASASARGVVPLHPAAASGASSRSPSHGPPSLQDPIFGRH